MDASALAWVPPPQKKKKSVLSPGDALQDMLKTKYLFRGACVCVCVDVCVEIWSVGAAVGCDNHQEYAGRTSPGTLNHNKKGMALAGVCARVCVGLCGSVRL